MLFPAEKPNKGKSSEARCCGRPDYDAGNCAAGKLLLFSIFFFGGWIFGLRAFGSGIASAACVAGGRKVLIDSRERHLAGYGKGIRRIRAYGSSVSSLPVSEPLAFRRCVCLYGNALADRKSAASRSVCYRYCYRYGNRRGNCRLGGLFNGKIGYFRTVCVETATADGAFSVPLYALCFFGCGDFVNPSAETVRSGRPVAVAAQPADRRGDAGRRSAGAVLRFGVARVSCADTGVRAVAVAYGRAPIVAVVGRNRKIG